MREIKFRAWDSHSKEMLYPPTIREYLLDNYNFSWGWMEDDFPIMQYTGLKDRNGKEIYEGDCVTFYADYGGDGINEPIEELEFEGLVVWDTKGCGFGIQTDLCKDGEIEFGIWDDSIGQWEVIGNIYEDPELLNGEDSERD